MLRLSELAFLLQGARNRCVREGMQWDPDNCLCICPIAEWKVCSSGYIFDFTNTCQCVPTSTEASMGLIAAIIVLIRFVESMW